MSLFEIICKRGNIVNKPKIGIIPGDPSGIGPELIAKLLAESQTKESADVLLIGDEHIFEIGTESEWS